MATLHECADGTRLVFIKGAVERRATYAAVTACREAGVEVKMITGDHPATARAIADRFGLTTAATVTRQDLRDLPAERLRRLVGETSVFATVSPEQKLTLVDALQHKEHGVAMTGDGVNDAPAQRRADIGVAMGRGGTEVAKQAADMVLANDPRRYHVCQSCPPRSCGST